MTQYRDIGRPHPDGISHRARLALAIAAALVMLMVVGVVEVGVLAAVTIVSSGRNHQ